MSLWGVRDTFAVTGTSIAVVNGSADIVGTGTSFTTQFQEGQAITISGVRYKILKITDNTHITLAIPYAGSSATVLVASLSGMDNPKYVHQQDLQYLYFVSREEAQLDSNKAKGLNEPGWWYWRTYVDADGNTRYKAEHLVAMDIVVATSGDGSDDLVVADTNPVITIGTQPSAQTTVSGAATFSVSATVSVVSPSATITYQWQKAVAGSTRYTNVSGATSASLVLSGQTSANTGDKYRVVMNTTPNGIAAVTSSSATLTFGT